MKNLNHLLSGLLALSLGLAACNPSQNTPAPATPEPTTPSPTAVPATPNNPTPNIPAEAVPHAFVEGNFSISLPAGWKVAGPFDATQYRLYTFGFEPGNSGGPGISQIILANEGTLTVEQFAQQQCNACPSNPIEDITLGGLPAKRTVIGGGSAPAFEWHFINHAGKLIGFSIRPAGDGLEWILPSVSFSTPPAAGQTQTYRNNTVGLELQVPVGWQITENTPPASPVMLDTLAYIFSQPQPATPPKGGEGPAEGVKIDVIALYDAAINQSLEQAIEWVKSGLSESNGVLVSERRVVLADGITAVRLQTSSTRGEGISFLAKVNDVMVLLGGSGKDLSLFDAAANTLRAVAPSGNDFGFACSLAYASEGRAYCPGDGGTAIPIADVSGQGTISQLAISSDGAWVAYDVNKSDGNGELWVVNVGKITGNDGLSAPRQMLVSNAQVPNADPNNTNSPNRFHWQPGTTWLYFDTRFIPAGGIQGPGEYVNNDLWQVDAQTGQVSNVLAAGAGGPFYFAPNGQRLAISTPTAIKLLTVNENALNTVLEFPSISTYSEYQYKPTVVWSSDNAFFTTLIPSADPLAADASGALYRVNADGVAQTVWTRLGNFVFGGAIFPAPDGQWMVSSTIVDNTPIWRISQIDDSSETVFANTPLSVNGWGWAPDSQHYAYGIVPDGQNFVLQINGAQEAFGAGTTPVALEWASPTQFYFLAVSGNAQYALYVHALGESTQLVVDGLAPGAVLDVRN